MIQIQCDKCDQTLEVDDSKAGTKIPCPHCGERVPGGALSCPSCGSDAETGWDEDGDVWAGDVPTGYEGDDFDDEDYAEFLSREGLEDPDHPSIHTWRRRGLQLLVMLLIVCLLAWLVR